MHRKGALPHCGIGAESTVDRNLKDNNLERLVQYNFAQSCMVTRALSYDHERKFSQFYLI